jgi:hypothetical protein
MQEQRISMHIPEFKWDDTEIIMGIPEFSMERQRWVIGLPQVTVTSAVFNPGPIRDKAASLKNRTAETIENQKRETIGGVHALFACHRSSLQQKRSGVESQFSTSLVQLEAAIQAFTAQGADPSSITNSAGTKMDLLASRDDLVKKRDTALSSFDKALSELDQSEKLTIDKMNGITVSAT